MLKKYCSGLGADNHDSISHQNGSRRIVDCGSYLFVWNILHGRPAYREDFFLFLNPFLTETFNLRE